MVRDVTGLVVLGSTGSIGRQTLDVVRALPGRFRVVGLAAGRNIALLRAQIDEFSPDVVWAAPGPDSDALAGELGSERWQPMDEMAARPDVGVVLVATVGTVGLAPTLAALEAGNAVALANKEVLIVGGHWVRAAAIKGGGELRPVDSEHSAIWQCLRGEPPGSIDRLTLTASGGALRNLDIDQLDRVTPEQALRHPNWEMGPKVTIDSATLFNKGLEVIEARWLFDIPVDRIDIVLHRESIVHSLVTFVDGSVKAQLGEPDMKLPIQCALTYPERAPEQALPRLDLAARGSLNFGEVDDSRFPALGLALEAARREGTYAAALSGADEAAVEHFLAGRCRFTDIGKLLGQALDAHQSRDEPSLDDLLAAEQWGHRFVEDAVAAGVR
ncbi:MAG: 1-deoxy-D-xylulose-5-phosphate reductoisomerase [Dehalococcoidia bacterium]